MATLAIVLGLVLVGFGIGFASCALSVSTRRKDDCVEFEILNNQNATLRNSIQNYIDIISSLTGKVFDQQDSIDDLTAQIKDMKIVRTDVKQETYNLFTNDFISNAEILAESNHELFMKCIDEILIDTFISYVKITDSVNKRYMARMNDGSIYHLENPEKLVYFVKTSYDLKKSLNAITVKD